MSIKIGSLFAGIGGFELGLERAIPGAQTIWQVEKEPFCQSILNKHWPHAQLFDDVCAVGAHNLPPVDILCGGFPCQDISIAGSKEGLNGKKSGLWFEMRRIISELRPPIIILENVAAITIRGLPRVLGDLAEIGYDAEWCVISARDFGAPHLRKRWFCVAYKSGLSNERRTASNTNAQKLRTDNAIQARRKHTIQETLTIKGQACNSTDALRTRGAAGVSEKEPKQERHTEEFEHSSHRQVRRTGKSYWATQPEVCGMVDGFPSRAHQLKALGNAIVPQCAEWVGLQVLNSGLLDNL